MTPQTAGLGATVLIRSGQATVSNQAQDRVKSKTATEVAVF